ncbi:MAG: hypothetical protein F6J98_35165 [Moorea sp. SIO4G2]|nr:hypothetical protein [Moorena sp. SIO4G2]
MLTKLDIIQLEKKPSNLLPRSLAVRTMEFKRCSVVMGVSPTRALHQDNEDQLSGRSFAIIGILHLGCHTCQYPQT